MLKNNFPSLFEISIFVVGTVWGLFVLPSLLPNCEAVQFDLKKIAYFRYLVAGILSIITISTGYSFFRNKTRFKELFSFMLGQGLGMSIYSIFDMILVFRCYEGFPPIPNS